jgi:hypothetical protein
MPDNGLLIVIDVPPQPEELKPFLVHGAVVDGKAEREFISIVRRQGDEAIPPLAAGRGTPAAWGATARFLAGTGGVAELHVVGNDFLPDLNWQVTGDAVHFEMIFFADDEAQEGR